MGNEIVIVDDDERITRALGRYLEREGFDVHVANTADGFRALIADHEPALIIMDLGLPDEDGLALTRELRVKSDVPLIILSGKSDPVDRIVGLEVGADDYVTKPFEAREILARIKAVMRRYDPRRDAGDPLPSAAPSAENAADDAGQGAAGQGEAEADAGTVRFADWRFSPEAFSLTGPAGAVTLTRKEFDLLKAFIEHPNRVLERAFILDLVGGEDWAPYDRRIDMLVAKLRKKLGDDPDTPAIIKTVRGFGYQFLPKVTRA